jgi:ribosomal protein S18 acetylase RimI-like enzyme
MEAIVQHRMNTATAQQVEAHLLACDAAFIPPLRRRVDVPVYAAKIAGRAQCFEAWSGDTLVGLVAAYLDPEAARAFVTNVSVLPEWTGRGVASALLRQCVAHARNATMGEVALEVDPRNAAAVALYERIGFRPAGGAGPPLAMTLQLVDKT